MGSGAIVNRRWRWLRFCVAWIFVVDQSVCNESGPGGFCGVVVYVIGEGLAIAAAAISLSSTLCSSSMISVGVFSLAAT